MSLETLTLEKKSICVTKHTTTVEYKGGLILIFLLPYKLFGTDDVRNQVQGKLNGQGQIFICSFPRHKTKHSFFISIPEQLDRYFN